MSPELPPNVGAGLIKRALLAAVLIVLMTAGAVSAAGFLTADDIINVIEKEGRAPIAIPEKEIDRAEAGKAQTIMILGSDERYGEKKLGVPARSDTIILVRLDPDKGAIAMMSLPRDLRVMIPGHGMDKINAAYSIGGPRLTLKTVKQLLSVNGENFKVHHIVNINFGGFRRAIDYIGCVYADIDKRYFNDNSSGENYATIDIQPGYQKVCGRDALDYVRYRHTDNDVIRTARQQDFLRQIKSQSQVRNLLHWDKRKEIAKLFARYTDADPGLRKKSQIFSILKLVLFTAGKPIREVGFQVTDSADRLYLDASQTSLERAVREFLDAKASSKARTSSKPTKKDREFNRRRRKNNRAADIPGLEIARREGEDQAVLAAKRVKFPFYFPTQRFRGSAYAGTEPRVYGIRDERGKLHRAYRLVLALGAPGEYYGVQGMTWRYPPILDDPTETVTRSGRKLDLYYDGGSLRLVAWRTKNAVYWVSNTLTQALKPRQMIGIATSLRRLGQK